MKLLGWSVFLLGIASLASCSGAAHGSIGQPCVTGGDCTAPLVCVPDLPGGYCTADCSTANCAAGQTCSVVGGASLCLKNCAQPGDCRSDYQCFNGVCGPKCMQDVDCGVGFQCAQGLCTPYSGAPLGAACAVDMDCSSRTCLLAVCSQSCNRDGLCPQGQTCALNPVGDGGQLTPTTHVTPACIPRRNKAAPGTACATDGDCDRGSCQLGLCVELCATTPDCHGPSMTCAKAWTVLDNESNAAYQGCLPSSGTLQFSADKGFLPLPSTAQSFALYTHASPFDFNDVVGVSSLTDPTMAAVYTPPMTLAEFYMLKERYQPSESTATMLVPNSPSVTILPGVYGVATFASRAGVLPSTDAYVKLGAGPIAAGSVTLNFYLTDLAGACRPLSVSSAPAALAGAVTNIKQIFSQVNVTVADPTYQSTNATNTVRFTSGGGAPLPDLDNTLQAATTGQPTTAGLDVVIVRSITDQNGANMGILGVAGGIPTSPVLATPHSAVIVTVETLCNGGGTQLFASTAAHELGHSVGLFHNVEQDGHTDPLTDTSADGDTNLMFWLESGIKTPHLSVQQGQVIRNDPKVH